MARAGLDANLVVEAAAELADADGLQALTLARLAEHLGVRAPSLYAHVDGLTDLRRRLAERGARQLGGLLASAAAGRAGGDALAAVADVYRRYAREHPGSYAALQRVPELNADPAAAREPVDAVLAALRGYRLEGDDAIHAVRIIRAALHGFVALESAGGFGLPLDLEETFTRLVTVLDHGLAA